MAWASSESCHKALPNYLSVLGKQIKNDFARDPLGSKERATKLLDLLLHVHSYFGFDLSIKCVNEVYPCPPPSNHSFFSDDTLINSTDCVNAIICLGESLESFKHVFLFSSISNDSMLRLEDCRCASGIGQV